MPVPVIVPILALLGVGVALAAAGGKDDDFPNLPPELQGNLKTQLHSNMDPASLRLLAATLRMTANQIDPAVTPGASNPKAAADYRRAAAALEARAAQLEFQRGRALPAPGAPRLGPGGAPAPFPGVPGLPGAGDPIAQAASILAQAGPAAVAAVDQLAKAAPAVPPSPIPAAPPAAPTPVINPATVFPPGVDIAAEQAKAMPGIQQGSVDPPGAPGPVAAWQRILIRDAPSSGVTTGFSSDGNFGPITAAATQRWQAAHGLTPDGIVGQLTWTAAFRTFPGGVAPMTVPPIGPAIPPTFPGLPSIPQASAPVVLSAVPHYVVAPGDFAGAIAQRFGQTLHGLAVANPQHGANWAMIRAGERFNIPPNWRDQGPRPHASGALA